MKKILLFLLLFHASLALAATPEQTAQQISETVMSPFCPGRTLAACPSDEARKLRGKVLDWVQAGDSQDVIESKLVQSYGVDVLGAPEAEGVGLLAWLVPFAAVTLAIVAVVVAARVMSADKSLQTNSGVEAVAEPMLKERLEREIKERMI